MGKAGRQSLIEFDLTKKYPVKTLHIQDIADVEYLLLESHDDFLFVHFTYLSDNYFIAENNFDRSFVFFDKKGKPVCKVAREGQGTEEYSTALLQLYLDEEDEFYNALWPNEIKVYTKEGVYKRTLKLREGALIDGMYNYNEDCLLCHDSYAATSNSFFLVSKEDGHTVEEIPVFFTDKIDRFIFKMVEGVAWGASMDDCFAVKTGDNLLLNEYSSDTLFLYTPERRLYPFFVRKPSVQKMEPPVVVHAFLETTAYSFFATQKREFDFEENEGLKKRGYLRDKQSGKIYRANLLNHDYAGQDLILSPFLTRNSSNPGIGVEMLHVSDLLIAEREGKLSGSLKELMDNLLRQSAMVEDPFVLMVMKFN
jgi:hypothetical protein